MKSKTKRRIWEGGHGARGDELGGFLDLDKAHTTISSNGESTVITKPWNVYSIDLAGLNNRHALRDFHREPIDEHFDGIIRVREVYTGTGYWFIGWRWTGLRLCCGGCRCHRLIGAGLW
ncbi:hypothetical protein COLO4_05243 [Corchorus olitorius]|uniref:Uncharacterized protein n=1 Tax=Corchorus olitorius TaxID=93759 RepID=A0A1R3KRG1_9ROSI|nr:hypothetical protein COLO4_05243 [Corchorus olitorius]